MWGGAGYLNAVPKISFTVPVSVFAMERKRMVRAMSMIWSSVTLPVCLTVAGEQAAGCRAWGAGRSADW